MNHAAVYESLMTAARSRELEGYAEAHHVLPRCMGGGDDASNIVRLTPEEHFVAHQLLVHMHPEQPRLVFAVLAMCRNMQGLRPNNKLFGWMRRRMGRVISAAKTGVPRPPEAIEKRRQKLLGRPLSPDHIEAIKAGTKGRPHTPEHNAKVGRKGRVSPMKGRTHSEETKAKQRAAAEGRRHTAETLAKIATALTPEQRSARAHKAWATKRAKSPAAG